MLSSGPVDDDRTILPLVAGAVPVAVDEGSVRPVAAAIANAVFDATGVRLRRAPLTPERLKPALA